MSIATTGAPSVGEHTTPSGGATGALPGNALPEMWVARWVDYSSKYGIGYVLSDGAIGVYFNDSTKAVLGPDGRRFDYITRRTQEKPEVTTSHAIDDHPEELKKKVTLLRHFKGFLLGDAGVRKNECTSG